MDKEFKRVAIYLRLSNEDRDKNESTNSESIKNQRRLLLDEIFKRKNFKLIDEYCDEDLSGAGTYRPEFERLIKDCEDGKIDVVLCKSQSRFSRDVEIIEKYLHNKFLEWNVRFISLADNADTNNSGNKKSRQINGLVNEWYLEDVSNNIRSAFKAKMIEGEFISPFAAFGYKISKKDNNKLIIDPIAAEIVKDIYNLYLNGMGFTGIAKYLNDNNIPSPSFYKYQNGIKLNINSNKPREKIQWSTNCIKTILTNELYIGNLIQGKRTTISYKNHKIKTKNKEMWIRKNNTHEAIISENIFYKVQVAIKERTRQLKRSDFVHIFSGKVFCLECGSYMRKKNSAKHQYLVCSNINCINKCSIRYDELEKIILNLINKKIYKYYDKNLIISFINMEHINKKLEILNKEKLKIEKDILKIRNYLKNIYEDKCNGIIDKEQFKSLSKCYKDNELAYLHNLHLINIQMDNYKKNFNCKDLKIIINKYKHIVNLNKVIIDEFIKKISISHLNKEMNSRTIKIEWNFNIEAKKKE